MTAPTMIDSTDGVQVALHDLGGDGPLLLLCHATGFHAKVWGPVAARLPDFQCVAPDLRGHGDSVVPPDLTYEWSGFADDVLAVVDHLGVEHGLAAGHSKGGASLVLAEERRPGTFRSLYLYEPVIVPPVPADVDRGPNPLAEGVARRRDTFDSLDAAYQNFAAKPPFDALDPDALRAYVDGGFAVQDDGTVRIKCRPAVESEVYQMAGFADAFAHLGEVVCPVTVAVGIDDAFGPAAFAPRIVDELPHGRLERHPDLAHFGPLENPATIAACIRAALAGE